MYFVTYHQSALSHSLKIADLGHLFLQSRNLGSGINHQSGSLCLELESSVSEGLEGKFREAATGPPGLFLLHCGVHFSVTTLLMLPRSHHCSHLLGVYSALSDGESKGKNRGLIIR